MEEKWWHQSVVYQVYPKSFNDKSGDGIGDIQGIISKLDYLHKLGIDVIWLSPVYQSPMDDNGYDISDYREVAKEFGTMEDMELLLASAHDKGIKIIMDLVVNHTSDEHEWFVKSKQSKDNPYRDYYIWKKPKEDGSPPNDMLSIFSGSAWEYDEHTGEYYFHMFSKKQPDLNWQNPKVQEEIHKMMNWWLDKGIDGFRMDVIDLIGKEIDKGITWNGEQLHSLIRSMNEATLAHRDVLTVGETWSVTPDTATLYSSPARKELSMVFQFEHITINWDDIHGKWVSKPFDLVALKQVFNKWQTFLADEVWNSLFWSNHDLSRVISKYGDPINYRVESGKMLATLLHMMKGTPYIYQGEELGMTNVHFDSIDDYKDLETLNFYNEKVANGFSKEEMMKGIWENSRDNARTPMHWNADSNAGFTTGIPWIKLNPNYQDINVEAALSDENSIFYHYQNLIALRKKMPIIIYGTFELLYANDPKLFVYKRSYKDNNLLVINNFSRETTTFSLDDEYKCYEVLLANYNKEYNLCDEMILEPFESIVLFK